VGRVGEASDIARAYLFFMQEEFATGQNAVVDGGEVLVRVGRTPWSVRDALVLALVPLLPQSMQRPARGAGSGRGRPPH